MAKVKHSKVSGKADGTDSSVIRPTDWNADHTIASDAGSIYLGRDQTGPGPIQEFAVQVSGAGDDMTMMTKAAIEAAIAAALAGYKPFATGDVATSIGTTKSGGWVLCNGQSLMLANGEPNHALFLMLWAFDTPTGKWPVTPSRGMTAEADWLAGKQLPVPDASGCVLGMVDPTDSINSLLNLRGIRVGSEKISLTIPNLPEHDHTSVVLPGSNAASVGGPVAGVVAGVTGKTGGDPAAVPAFSAPVPVNVTQPTLGVNFFIKL